MRESSVSPLADTVMLIPFLMLILMQMPIQFGVNIYAYVVCCLHSGTGSSSFEIFLENFEIIIINTRLFLINKTIVTKILCADVVVEVIQVVKLWKATKTRHHNKQRIHKHSTSRWPLLPRSRWFIRWHKHIYIHLASISFSLCVRLIDINRERERETMMGQVCRKCPHQKCTNINR